MNIDGHAVRIESIDAVMEIEVSVTGVHEGAHERAEKVARGQFDILIRGQKLSITRAKRFAANDEPLKKASVKTVRDELTEIRNHILASIP